MTPPPRTQAKQRTSRRVLAVFLMALAVVAACEESTPVDPGTRLCGGEGGVGLRVLGRAQPVDICLEDEEVSAVFSNLNQYSVTARMVTDETIFELQMTFTHDPDFPSKLVPTANLAAAVADPGLVWLYYQEIPSGGDPIESSSVQGGPFTLSFSGGDVVAGTLEKIEFSLRNQRTGAAVGKRTIETGFFSISTDDT